MKYSDIREMTVGDLKAKKKELGVQMFEAKMKNSLGQLSNPLTIRWMRKDLARVETAIKQKEQV